MEIGQNNASTHIVNVLNYCKKSSPLGKNYLEGKVDCLFFRLSTTLVLNVLQKHLEMK